MDRLDNIFSQPSRRDLLKLGLVCGAAGLLCRQAAAWAQDEAGREAAPSRRSGSVVRHEAMFWEEQPKKQVRCLLCPHKCRVADKERGLCGVRENQDGKYQTLVYGPLCSANADPIEKKPLFHYVPGTMAFSVATAGCNLQCQFCQNWQISQSRPEEVESTPVPPEQLVAMSKARGCPTIAYTYSEPTVFYEYMHDTARLGRRQGLGSVMISNGFMREEPLRELCRRLTAVKIDFKAFSQKFYEETCSGDLEPVLKTLETLKEIGIWFELVVLIVPTLNDSPEDTRQMSEWVVKHLGPDVPMHFTRFHPTYRLTNLPQTPIPALEQCRKIALEAGVRYVYAGNVPGHPSENTYCHNCKAPLIERMGFRVSSNRIKDGKCHKCGTAIPGVWSQEQALAFKPREKNA